ncbi:digestive organ expansion factor [Pyrrhoderma noxium]|uniref:U3 small nucleolar RNA-associated protein 25 n=1 Tax=Pyrrhoderma noxium TaxID=2282107 RepID=A0A286UHD2_9AGAM|nr:digestive organ expansion factor [Pyrrhoderma noxium]
MAIDQGSTATTKLLTLLNVSATKVGKRKRVYGSTNEPTKLNKRKKEASPIATTLTNDSLVADEENHEDASTSYFSTHFQAENPLLSERTRKAIDEKRWNTKKGKKEYLGMVTECLPEDSNATNDHLAVASSEKLRSYLKQQQESFTKDLKQLHNALLSEITSYKDFYISRISHTNHIPAQNAISFHVLNHITKKRRRILKNNERIAHATKEPSDPTPQDIQDQGFTRPSVLILLPFRSWALRWVEALTKFTPKPDFQLENYSRFLSEYGLPPDATDKLEAAPPGTYPPDHIEMFRGNVDDSFRLGIKFTRKSVKFFADFYQCDIIIASPLGLRMSIDKEKNADFLSSIEVLILDQMNALSMQNWEHLQFVLSNLNKLPKETRDTDFSRIKPWYLDGHAAYLRQTIMLSPFDTPEFRHLFNSELINASGKGRLEGTYEPVQVPEGIAQSFISFECGNFKDEADKRFQYFSTKILPAALKSAVQSTNTLIFVSSSYDFIRVENHLRKTGVSFTVLSEYSSNQDISRARQAFFSGKKNFLLISERFHFFRRYKIRGVRNILFYSLPNHAQFYSEFLSAPFLDDGVEASDVTCKSLYSKYDWMKLERIVGTESSLDLLRQI